MKILIEHTRITNIIQSIDVMKLELTELLDQGEHKPEAVEFSNGDFVIGDDCTKEEYAVYKAYDSGNERPYLCDRIDSKGVPMSMYKNYKSIRLMNEAEIKNLVLISKTNPQK